MDLFGHLSVIYIQFRATSTIIKYPLNFFFEEKSGFSAPSRK